MITWGCTTTYIRDSQNPWTGNPEKKPTIRRNFMQDDIRIWCGDCFKAGLSFLVSCFVMFFLIFSWLDTSWYRTMIWYCTVHPLCAISAMLIEEIQGTVSRWFRFCPWEAAKCGKSHGRIQGWWYAEESWARLACPVLQTTSDWSSNAGGSELEEMDLQATNYQWDFIGQDQPDQSANFIIFMGMIQWNGISYPLSTYINIIHFFGLFHERWVFTIFLWHLMGPMGQFWLVRQGVMTSMVNGT